MPDYDVVVIGSGGGGGALAWVMAKAGKRVLLLEQGPSDAEVRARSQAPLAGPPKGNFDPKVHSEYDFRLRQPDIKRRAYGDYNTFRRNEISSAKPSRAGWTASLLGGGSTIWGAWSLRALPVDFELERAFAAAKITLDASEYSVVDWPIPFSDFAAYYPLAELLFGVAGNRENINTNLKNTSWIGDFGPGKFGSEADWYPKLPFPNPSMPRTPIGAYLAEAFALRKNGSNVPAFDLPMGIVPPGVAQYQPGAFYATNRLSWPDNALAGNPFQALAIREACRQCGYCGEFLCFGGSASPKAGTQATVLAEMQAMSNVEIRTHARVYQLGRNGSRIDVVKYLDVSASGAPVEKELAIASSTRVVVSCGAVQSARLLLLSGFGGGDSRVGRYATFHLFGLSAKAVLRKELRGQVHAELGPTGNTGSFEPYFVKTDGKWRKLGIITSTAKKNPLENAVDKLESGTRGNELLKNIDDYNRTVEIRCTADDLPSPNNRVDLDPQFVDQYGIPVARITRDFGTNERWLFANVRPELEGILRNHPNAKALDPNSIKSSDAIVDLIGDHQMGTCRMGDDPKTSVVDKWCKVHNTDNLYVVDSSFMPTGLGLNPMITVVANALRVATGMLSGKT
jgi:choline dehydrogenase-like flavoprotein